MQMLPPSPPGAGRAPPTPGGAASITSPFFFGESSPSWAIVLVCFGELHGEGEATSHNEPSHQTFLFPLKVPVSGLLLFLLFPVILLCLPTLSPILPEALSRACPTPDFHFPPRNTKTLQSGSPALAEDSTVSSHPSVSLGSCPHLQLHGMLP